MASTLRVGNGYDIHRLVPQRKLIIGGVHVPFDLGLEGHSDGDVLIHAIMDALLGASALGDIGLFFPPNDSRFANANSVDLLTQVYGWLKEKGYDILNIDTVIVCERPKLATHYPAMQTAIGRVLNIGSDQINIKAKTAEGLGDIGSGDAIAAYACALIERSGS